MATKQCDLDELLSAVRYIFYAVEQMEQICQEAIDCRDARLVDARRCLAKAQDILEQKNLA